jgi:hypothetical protein
MKKILALFVTFAASIAFACFLASCGIKTTEQSGAEQKIQKPINLTVNGNKAAFEKGFPHTGENGKTLVPLEFFNRYLGADVHWNKEAQTIHIGKDKTGVDLKVGESQARVNGKALYMACPVEIEDGVAMVPIRVVSEALGATVGWDAATHDVSIVTSGTKPQ